MSEAVVQKNKIIEDVRRWLASFIIDLNLCPFAKRELVKDRIRFSVSLTESSEQLLVSLLEELQIRMPKSEAQL